MSDDSQRTPKRANAFVGTPLAAKAGGAGKPYETRKAFSAPELRKLRQAVDELLSTVKLRQDTEALVRRANAPGASAFERYAGTVLADAGALKLREVAPLHALHLLPPNDGKLARIVSSARLTDEENAIILNVEDAVNRLICIADAVQDGYVENVHEQGGHAQGSSAQGSHAQNGQAQGSSAQSGHAQNGQAQGSSAHGGSARRNSTQTAAQAQSGSPLPHDNARIGLSVLGSGYLPVHPGYRSAQVKLPHPAGETHITPAYLNEVDWRVLDHVASNAHTVFQSCLHTNKYQSLMGAYAARNSDWDVRTRMASILESLELPLRFAYAFDCDTSIGNAAVHFRMPPTTSFPASAHGDASGALRSCADKLGLAQMSYAIRLGCLLASACFGAGRVIERAFVVAEFTTVPHAPALSLAYERKDFVFQVLTAIDDGALSDAAFRFDPYALAQLIGPDHMEIGRIEPRGMAHGEPTDRNPHGKAHAELAERIALENQQARRPESLASENPQPQQSLASEQPCERASEAACSLAIPDDGLSAQRIEPWRDERPLSPEMTALFRSNRVLDTDTLHYFGEHAAGIDAAKDDAEDSLISAIATLENVIDSLSAGMRPPNDDADARPLYSANPYARAMVPLLDDEATVGQQAEAFLRGEPDKAALPERLPTYFRAPDALYHAHMGLSDLYERIGDYRGSEAEADRCIALAPTTVRAHFRKADILAQQDKLAQAANVILAALPLAVTRQDCALLYYHLGLLFWRMGKKREAAAVYVYTASLSGEFAEKAMTIVKHLRRKSGSSVIVHASPRAAAREMANARIPLSPSNEARSLMAQAAVGLACTGAPVAATPYAEILAQYFRDDYLLTVVARSLKYGTEIR